MLTLPGAVGYDPHTRRRTRRALARLRPWVLPVAVVVAALLLSGRPTAEHPAAGLRLPQVPAAPAGTVLVAVTPNDPAVLGLVVAGSRVDVYAASSSVGPDGDGALEARLVAAAALVLGPGDGAGTAGTAGGGGPDPTGPGGAGPGRGLSGAGPGGGLGGGLAGGLVTGSGTGASALTLAVTDAEAAALAARPGSGLTLAVRPP